jgi:choline dehydrogenase
LDLLAHALYPFVAFPSDQIIMTMLAGSGVGIQAGLQHPYSRGSVMINSTSPLSKPVINPHYYGIEKDIEILQLGIGFARKLAATKPMSDREPSLSLPA